MTKTSYLAFQVLAVVAISAATTAQAAIIAVIDAQTGTANSVVFDRSTSGDSAAGITGSYSTTESVSGSGGFTGTLWDENGTHLDNLTNGASDSATWTFSGLNVGDTYNVYTSWRSTGGGATFFADNVPYTINGGADILKSHQVAPTADQTLTDAVNPNGIPFELLASVTVDGSGQILVNVRETATQGGRFIYQDAIAIERTAVAALVPEPSSVFVLASLGVLGIGFRRRWSRNGNVK